MSQPLESDLARWYGEHRSFLWGLCYRMTGCAADADDLVQETFVRAMQNPPPRLDEPLRPWLVRVAMNLARDLLRQRKRRGYEGPWLPGPIDTPSESSPPSHEPTVEGEHTLEARYDLLESVSLAFLQALETLTPKQRGVLLLCDVFDYSAAETATALDISEANVRTVHHRARRTMEAYHRRRIVPNRSIQMRTSQALQRFLDLLRAADVAAIEKMLAADVRAITDGGGEFVAALRPIMGPERVARFFVGLATNYGGGMQFAVRLINGLPAVVLEFAAPRPRQAPRLVLSLDIDPDDHISMIRVVAATRKLTAVAPLA